MGERVATGSLSVEELASWSGELESSSSCKGREDERIMTAMDEVYESASESGSSRKAFLYGKALDK